MDDIEILAAVRGLVDEEHDLRDRLASGALEPAEVQPRLRRLEESLDRCWDLLRQRRARREAGQNPEQAQVRDTDTVEGYQQ